MALQDTLAATKSQLMESENTLRELDMQLKKLKSAGFPTAQLESKLARVKAQNERLKSVL